MNEFRRLINLWPWLRPYRWWMSALLLGSVAFFTLAQMPPLFMAWLLDRALPSGYLWMAFLIVGGYFGVFLLRHVFSILMDYAYTLVGTRILADMQRGLFRNLLRADIRFFHRRQLGDLLARLSDDVEVIRSFLSETVVDILSNFLTLAISVAVMAWFNWRLALAVIVFLPLIPLPFKWGRKGLRQAFAEQRKANGANVAFLQEGLSAILPIRIAGAEDQILRRQRGVAQRLIQTTVRMRVRQMQVVYVAEIMGNLLSPLLVLGLGSYLVYRGGLSIGQLVASGMYATGLVAPVVALSKINVMLQGVLASIDRIDEVLQAPAIQAAEPVAAGISCEITVNKINFSYNGRDEILKGISLAASIGERIAIVGQSGSGKSTLACLLSGLFPPDKGAVLLDDKPVHTLANRAKLVTLVPQEPFLFHDTIEANLRFGSEGISADAMHAAARAAQIEEFIRSLPQGYATPIGERGVTVSGGERQRLMLARALLGDPKVLILDEITANLDLNTEEAVLRSLDELRGKTTVILITHRISAALSADRVYVLQDGRIVEDGRPRELLSQGGSFARLYANHISQRTQRTAGAKQ